MAKSLAENFVFVTILICKKKHKFGTEKNGYKSRK